MYQKYVEIWEATKSSRKVLIYRMCWQLKIYVWIFLIVFGCYEVLNTSCEYNSSLPFLPSYVNSISLEDTFHYVGKKVVWCSDNKFRECKAVKLNFEYEGHPYSELFFIDKSVEEDYAILGSTFWSKCDILK